jgi:hypothetical protein
VTTEDLPGDNRDDQNADEARVQLLAAKAMERYERLLRRLVKE